MKCTACVNLRLLPDNISAFIECRSEVKSEILAFEKWNWMTKSEYSLPFHSTRASHSYSPISLCCTYSLCWQCLFCLLVATFLLFTCIKITQTHVCMLTCICARLHKNVVGLGFFLTESFKTCHFVTDLKSLLLVFRFQFL